MAILPKRPHRTPCKSEHGELFSYRRGGRGSSARNAGEIRGDKEGSAPLKKTTKENLIFAIIIVTQTVLWLALGVCGCLVAYGIGRIIGG